MQTTSAQIYAHSIQWCNSSSFSVIKVVQQERTWGYFHNETIKTYPSHLSIAYPNVFSFCSASYSECYINLKTCSSMIISVTIFLNLYQVKLYESTKIRGHLKALGGRFFSRDQFRTLVPPCPTHHTNPIIQGIPCWCFLRIEARIYFMFSRGSFTPVSYWIFVLWLCSLV